MTYQFKEYDILQVKSPAGRWEDFATLRYESEGSYAHAKVDASPERFRIVRHCCGMSVVHPGK